MPVARRGRRWVWIARAAAESRQRFCEKWGLAPDAKVAAAVRALAKQPFDPARDHIAIGGESPAAPPGGAVSSSAPVLRLLG